VADPVCEPSADGTPAAGPAAAPSADGTPAAASAATPSAHGAPAIRLQHAAVGYGERRIWEGLDLTVPAGEFLAVLGPNGAGKTTLLKVVLGLMRPTSGSVTLGVNGLAELGYLPENPYFYDYLTGSEFLRFCARLFSLGARERDERVKAILVDVGLERAAGVQLRKYSKGMLQRIGIAQALINEPRFVLLDEPMTGLDPIGRVEVKEIIQRLHERGTTVLFNSHILADVAALCTRIAIMRDGRVIWTGSVDEALAEAETLEDFFMRVVQA